MIEYCIELLDKHDRKSFDCGEPELNAYLRTLVSQDIRRRFAACYVLVDNASSVLAGYYTLSAGSVGIRDLSEDVARKLPRYPTVPVIRIGRLAVAKEHHGRKLGSLLLIDAISRAVKSEIAAYAVVVDAKSDDAIRFYEHHGFVRFPILTNVLYLPLSEAIRNLL